MIYPAALINRNIYMLILMLIKNDTINCYVNCLPGGIVSNIKDDNLLIKDIAIELIPLLHLSELNKRNKTFGA
jgi:hypothetical protein